MLAKALTEAEERKCLLLLRPDFSGGIEFASRAVSFEVAPGEALDLQLFAAEDEGRTEEPSERRKREERDKGNVPKSQDMAGSAILIGGGLMLFRSFRANSRKKASLFFVLSRTFPASF